MNNIYGISKRFSPSTNMGGLKLGLDAYNIFDIRMIVAKLDRYINAHLQY
jgi:hypothetical protein